MLTEKAITICLLEILKEYSDEKHILSMSDIIKKANTIYGLNPDRRTVYSAIDTLTSLGYDISVYSENKTGYYLRGREFEPSEIRLLTDAVFSFSFISSSQTKQLNAKLQSLLSKPERRQIKNLNCIRPERKTPNKSVFLNIEILDEAISAKVKVRFDYLSYGTDKQLHLRREKKYIVNPYKMVYCNEHYYLVCSMTYQTDVRLYRIDRMIDIELTAYPLDERDKDFDCDKTVKDAVYAFVGEPEKVEMLIDRGVLNDVIDKFGTDIHIAENQDNRLLISFYTSSHGFLFWALQYLDSVEVISPTSIRNEIIENINKCKYMSEANT